MSVFVSHRQNIRRGGRTRSREVLRGFRRVSRKVERKSRDASELSLETEVFARPLNACGVVAAATEFISDVRVW